MKLTPWMVLLSLSVVSCSGSKSAPDVNSESPQVELSDADEFVENPDEEVVSTDSEEAATEEAVTTDESAETASTEEQPVVEEAIVAEAPPSGEAVSTEEITATESVAPEEFTPAAESVPSDTVAVSEPVISNDYSGGTEKQYIVKKNETLMLVAFKLFGDYERWKELANANRDVLRGSTSLSQGMTLRYTAPAQEFVWNPQGLPYLIRMGDTLGGISKTVYTTEKKWKLIWNNNRPLIKDPNKIFAGFTIYYLENGREVAAEL
jgi:nucleoid-associated protein YgaU